MTERVILIEFVYTCGGQKSFYNKNSYEIFSHTNYATLTIHLYMMGVSNMSSDKLRR